MSRTRIAIALTGLLLTLTPAFADDQPAAKLLGRWALPGKAKLRWDVHTDGTVTGTANGKPVHRPDNPTGPQVTYTVGSTDEEGNVEVTFTVRPADTTAGEGVYKAKVEFTRQGRMTVKYTQKPADTARFPAPFPHGKKLYRPEDVTD